MTFQRNTENVIEKLRQHEIEELVEYCKEQGFTDEQTEIFVKNSISRLFNVDSE